MNLTVIADPEFLPKELHSVVTDKPDGDAAGEQRKKRLGLAKKSAVDKLANLDDDEAHGATDPEGDSNSDSVKDEDEVDREPGDDEFDEDDEEADNDYNAEKYFDDGEDDFEDHGGDDYGGDDGF